MIDTPRFAYATRELAIVACHLRDGRAAGDPKMVEAGKLTEAEAADRLRIADALATDWTYYAAMRLPPAGDTTDAEKLAMLERSLTVSAAHRDRAYATMIAEGAWLGQHDRGALWGLVDAHVPQTLRIEAYLHWESVTAAVEALLWWQRGTGGNTKRAVVAANIAMRGQDAAQAGRVAA